MQRIGRYEILEELGRGAMGAVYKARDPNIGRTVAIKVILAAGLSADELTQYKQRFYREAQTAGQVNHPGIVTIHDIAEDESGQPFLVMEFVDGVTLHRMLRPAHSGHLPERLPLDQALDLGAQVAEALDFAHKRNVIHRDVKPGNILVTPEGKAKIADFGIARFSDTEATRTATVVGTPAYMAPEQLRGGEVDARSDIFSLGAMLYWIVTGQKPFPGEDLTSVSFKVVYTDPTNPSEIDPKLPRELDTVISRCLAKNPHDRYANAKDLANDLQAIRAGRTILTTAAPRGGGAEPTVSTMHVPAKLSQPGSPLDAHALPGRRAPRIGIVVTGLVALAVFLVTYAMWPPERTVYVVVQQPAAATPAPAKGGKSPGAPVSKTASPTSVGGASAASKDSAAATSAAPAEPQAPPALTSGLEFECRHDFPAATLGIFRGPEQIVDAKLERKKRLGISYNRKLETDRPIPIQAGAGQLRVRVVSTDPAEPFDQEAVIEGDFPDGGSRRLLIEFPKGQLLLRWVEKK